MRYAFRAIPAVLLLASLTVLALPRRARSVPQYAARNGFMCQTCHFDPNGGGPRNDFGFAFAKNRHALEPEGEQSPWHDLALTNRIGENMPVYLGVNQRFMVLANAQVLKDSLDRFGFFNMENSLHIAFQPHPRLTLVYTTELNVIAGNLAQPKDAWGMIGGFPLEGYLKAGRFRTPYGLRMDDHTVATRNGFLDFLNQQSFLPFDPRNPDQGIELGASRGPFFGRMAYTNGASDPFGVSGNTFAEAKTVKLGYNAPFYQAALSLYDDYRKETASLRRATRWGYYGMTHRGPFSVLGEIGAGTDEREVPSPPFGSKINKLAYFGELDYAPRRTVNVRARYDHLELDRSSRQSVRDNKTYSRYALEGEVVPVPFGELRWTLRHVDYKKDQFSFVSGKKVDNENQMYLQFHFSY